MEKPNRISYHWREQMHKCIMHFIWFKHKGMYLKAQGQLLMLEPVGMPLPSLFHPLQ